SLLAELDTDDGIDQGGFFLSQLLAPDHRQHIALLDPVAVTDRPVLGRPRAFDHLAEFADSTREARTNNEHVFDIELHKAQLRWQGLRFEGRFDFHRLDFRRLHRLSINPQADFAIYLHELHRSLDQRAFRHRRITLAGEPAMHGLANRGQGHGAQ